MTKLEQAARQALDALEELFHSNSTKVAVEKYNTAHNALREALDHSGEANEMVAEQAEQEPVAWMNEINGFICKEKTRSYHVPLYAAPVRTKDLTDDEILDVCRGYPDSGILLNARAVIAADRAKNNLCGSANAEEKNK